MVSSRYAGIAVLALALVAPAASAAPAAAPPRIVSLSPTATEDLFAIGAGRQVVAVDDQSDYPKDAPHTSLSGITPNAEAVAGYRPDLVVVSYDANKIVEALGKLHVKVIVQPSATTLAQAYAQIEQLGAATGHAAGAAKVVSTMKQQIASIVAATPRPTPPITVYHEVSTGSPYYSATSKTFIGRVYTLLGLKDVADPADTIGTGYPQVSAEFVIGADPQLIVLADGQTAAQVKARPGWNTIAAVKDGDVVSVNESIASRWGPRIVDFVRAVAAAVKKVSGR
jgi:iron complex transport system substrate-binding protein